MVRFPVHDCIIYNNKGGMERAVILSYRKQKREFILSSKSKAQSLRNLIKKAFNLQSEIKCLRSAQGRASLEEVVGRGGGAGEYEVVAEEESEEERPLSEVCSQKNMTRVSGRKNPPSEKELLDSKFYIDDFQLFMSEVSGRKNLKLFGIVFFNSRKKASFLGKKILRELIFQFDKIQFFYALHPIKMHTTTALLGEVLVFSLFRGRKMIHEREFPEQITAADEILNYIKNLIRLGDITFDSPQHRKPRNLIHVHEQRSFDHKIENSPEKLSDFGGRPNRTAEIIKIKPVTPDKEIYSRKIFSKPESPMKSHITNEISFQNDLYQPEWFWEGEALTRLEKAVLSALIKANDSTLLSFLNGLNLKAPAKETLNVKLVKVFLQEFIDDKLAHLTLHQRKLIELNQDNRKSYVFNILLKLYKFGDLKEFVEAIVKGLPQLESSDKESEHAGKEPEHLRQPVEQKEDKPIERLAVPTVTVKYSSIAKNIDKSKTGFTIKLLDCENEVQASSPSEYPSPFRENSKLRNQHYIISSRFHAKPLEHVAPAQLKEVEFPQDYNEADRAGICDLILKGDAFMIECFVRKSERGKKADKLSPKVVKKYLREVESRYDLIRERTVMDAFLQLKIQKLQIFNGLVYYLYKQRIINKKQLKISFYLYTWSDLNVLAAFEVYLLDRSLDDFVDTLYSIDYNYYLHGLYEIDHSEVEHFTVEIEGQLIVLFLYEEHIESGSERISLEKFIRAGDTELLKLYTNLQIGDQELVRRVVQLSKLKKEELDSLNTTENMLEVREREKKRDRCSFIDQIVATRYRSFTKKDLVKQCINNAEPRITAIFDLLDQHNDQHEWIDSFNLYIQSIDHIHMQVLINQLAEQAGIDLEKLKQCRTDTIQGIYEAYMHTHDKPDTIDSLERAVKKLPRNSPR